MKYVVHEKNTGSIVDIYDTEQEALKGIKHEETEDKRYGCYKADSYIIRTWDEGR